MTVIGHKIGSLFSGVGGLELGLERAGLGTVSWQVEIDLFRRKVLAKYWPDALRYGDIHSVNKENLKEVDIICGGFPCQDVSQAARGRNTGLAGPKSGLWREYARVVGEMLPKLVIVENVFNGKHRWLPTVRRDLHVLGYRTRALRIDARDVGAPHIRSRVFVIAYPYKDGESTSSVNAKAQELRQASDLSWHWRQAKPTTLRMDDGIPNGLDRVEALGDAVVPQVAELVGRIILTDNKH